MIYWIYTTSHPSPSPGKKGEIWPWRVINPISKPRLWFRTKLLGLWQSRGANISVLNIAAKQAKLQNRLENADFSLPDLFEDILAGHKKDIASSHQLPRLHDDARLETIFHICCHPVLLRCEGNQEKKKSDAFTPTCRIYALFLEETIFYQMVSVSVIWWSIKISSKEVDFISL